MQPVQECFLPSFPCCVQTDWGAGRTWCYMQHSLHGTSLAGYLFFMDWLSLQLTPFNPAAVWGMSAQCVGNRAAIRNLGTPYTALGLGSPGLTPFIRVPKVPPPLTWESQESPLLKSGSSESPPLSSESPEFTLTTETPLSLGSPMSSLTSGSP